MSGENSRKIFCWMTGRSCSAQEIRKVNMDSGEPSAIICIRHEAWTVLRSRSWSEREVIIFWYCLVWFLEKNILLHLKILHISRHIEWFRHLDMRLCRLQWITMEWEYQSWKIQRQILHMSHRRISIRQESLCRSKEEWSFWSGHTGRKADIS